MTLASPPVIIAPIPAEAGSGARELWLTDEDRLHPEAG
jgi:hypothetical protein